MTTPHQAAVEIVARLYGTHHVVEPEPVTRTPQTCPDCAGSGANQNGSDWDCCDTCKGRKVI